MRMTLAQFKKACGLPSKISEFRGYSYMCIHRWITQDAESGLKENQITKSQYNSLIDWRNKILDSLVFLEKSC